MNLNLHLPDRKGLALERLNDRSGRGEFPAFDVDLSAGSFRRKIMMGAIEVESVPSRYL
jgi:hypothetical protein